MEEHESCRLRECMSLLVVSQVFWDESTEVASSAAKCYRLFSSARLRAEDFGPAGPETACLSLEGLWEAVWRALSPTAPSLHPRRMELARLGYQLPSSRRQRVLLPSDDWVLEQLSVQDGLLAQPWTHQLLPQNSQHPLQPVSHSAREAELFVHCTGWLVRKHASRGRWEPSAQAGHSSEGYFVLQVFLHNFHSVGDASCALDMPAVQPEQPER